MQLLARIRWLTLFAIQHLPPITNSITYKTILTSFITYNDLFYTILCTIFYNRESHCKILYSILLYQYYNIVNTCDHIVTIIFDMIYNDLNRYNCTDQNSYNILTMYYITITVYYISKNSDIIYRYKDLICHIRQYDVDNQIVGYLIAGEIMWEIMFTKNHITCNAYARINCINSIDTVENFWTIGVV